MSNKIEFVPDQKIDFVPDKNQPIDRSMGYIPTQHHSMPTGILLSLSKILSGASPLVSEDAKILSPITTKLDTAGAEMAKQLYPSALGSFKAPYDNPQANPIASGAGKALGIGGQILETIPSVELGGVGAANLIPKAGIIKSLASGAGSMAGAFAPSYENTGSLGAGITGAATQGALGGAAKTIKALSGVDASDYAKHIIKVLLGGRKIDELPEIAATAVKNAFNDNSKIGSSLYQNGVFEPAANMGMANNVNTKNFASALASVSKKNPEFTKYLKNTSPDLLNSLASKSPFGSGILQKSLDDVHSAQSSLYKDSQRLATKINDPKKTDTAEDLDLLRSAAKKDIANHFAGTPLEGAHNEASTYWSRNVIPFLENKKFSQVLSGKTNILPDISKLFKNVGDADEVHQTIDVIPHTVGDKFKNIILADALKSAVKTDGSIDAAKMHNIYNNFAHTGLSRYLSNDSKQMFDLLGKKLGNRVISTGLSAISKVVNSPLAVKLGHAALLSSHPATSAMGVVGTSNLASLLGSEKPQGNL